jgi:hypothetical protein
MGFLQPARKTGPQIYQRLFLAGDDYVRVLEIPTPSWLAYDKAFFGDVVDLPEDAVLVQQERAYTSPIWYTPQ